LGPCAQEPDAGAARAPRHLQAVDARQADVEHPGVERDRGDAGERLLSAGHLLDGVPVEQQDAAQRFAHRAVVVHHRDGRGAHLRPGV
jgi:hypothetical protein